MVAARSKRVWTVADFAGHAYGEDTEPACRRARRFLKRIDHKHGGLLLIPSVGTNREFTFMPAVLARLEPDLFTAIQSLEFRVDALEGCADTMKLDQRRTIAQLGQNTRDIERLKTRRRSAA